MNRLVIIGNGFDLAHGLPTGYCDFIDSYWEKVIQKLDIDINKTTATSFKDEILDVGFEFRPRLQIGEINYLNDEILKINSFKALSEFILKHKKSGDSCFINFNNKFFEIINSKRTIQNWVDIENEYFKILKGKVTPNSSIKYLGNVQQLNKEFEQVKKLLEKYLNENINSKFDFSIVNTETQNLLKNFKVKYRYLDSTSLDDSVYLKEFPKEDHEDLISLDYKIIESSKKGLLKEHIGERYIIQDILFLNFNYTYSLDYYIKAINSGADLDNYGTAKHIQIHGRLNDINNKINFGFGDEMDDDYKKIENKDDNEYLRNIKSFQYLQNSNYKDMLDFIESNKFQVYIMGHSCGLSDRILLNKIFEHHNCRSIKVFYHKFDEPKADGREDNFTEIIQNISRHFNKKEMMREKIVNKTLCQPLPQEIRFKEKNNGS